MSRENFKRHEESTNNVPLRFDFAHRITRWRGDTFDNNSTNRNMFGYESNFLETQCYKDCF